MTNQPTGDETTDFSVGESVNPTPDIHLGNSRPLSRIFIQADGATHVKKMTLKREIVSRKQIPDPQEVRQPNYQVTQADQLGVSCQLPQSKSMPLNCDGAEFGKCLYHVTVSESSCDFTGCDSQAPKRDDAHMLLNTLDSRSNPELTEHLDMIAWQLGLLNTKGAPKITGENFDYRSYEEMNTRTVPDIQSQEHARLSRTDSTVDKTPPAAVAGSASQLRVRTLSRSCPRRLVTLFQRLSPCRRQSSLRKAEGQGQEGPRQSRSLTRLFSCTSSRAEETKKPVDIGCTAEDPATHISSGATEPIAKKTTVVLKSDIPQRLWDTEEDKGRSSTLPVSLSFELDSSLQRSRTLPLHSRMLQSLTPNYEHKTPVYLNAALCAYGYGRKPDWKQFSISPSLRRLMRTERSDPTADGENKGTISTHELEEPIVGTPAPTQMPVSEEDQHVTDEHTPATDQHPNQEEILSTGDGEYLSEPKFKTCNGVQGQTPKDIFSLQDTRPSVVTTAFSITVSPKVTHSSTTQIERARSGPMNLVTSSDFSTMIDIIQSTTPPMIRRNSAAAVKARAAKIAQARKNALKVIIGEIDLSETATPSKTQEDPADQQAATGDILPVDSGVRAGVFQPFIRRRPRPPFSPPEGHNTIMHLQSISELSLSDSSFEKECLSPLSHEKSKAQSLEEITDNHLSDQQKRSV